MREFTEMDECQQKKERKYHSDMLISPARKSSILQKKKKYIGYRYVGWWRLMILIPAGYITENLFLL